MISNWRPFYTKLKHSPSYQVLFRQHIIPNTNGGYYLSETIGFIAKWENEISILTDGSHVINLKTNKKNPIIWRKKLERYKPLIRIDFFFSQHYQRVNIQEKKKNNNDSWFIHTPIQYRNQNNQYLMTWNPVDEAIIPRFGYKMFQK